MSSKNNWEPQAGDIYYYVDITGAVHNFIWCDDPTDYSLRAAGNIFQTRELAEKAAEYMRKTNRGLRECSDESKPEPTKTLRDEFAMAVLPTLLYKGWDVSNDEIAKQAYRLADAMMKERNNGMDCG